MFGLATLSGNAHAAAVVGLVLAESLALYVGYGFVTNAAGAAVVDAIGGE
ncbi:DUF7512 family protein [Halegenticoccus tardaugens]|nr:hypothetical protein [Halegenticoccus tardaugens]